MPEETEEVECVVTIGRSTRDHYGDVKGCECVSSAWLLAWPGLVRAGLSVSNLCNMSLSPLPPQCKPGRDSRELTVRLADIAFTSPSQWIRQFYL